VEDQKEKSRSGSESIKNKETVDWGVRKVKLGKMKVKKENAN